MCDRCRCRPDLDREVAVAAGRAMFVTATWPYWMTRGLAALGPGVAELGRDVVRDVRLMRQGVPLRELVFGPR